MASHSPNFSSSSTFSNHHYFIYLNCLFPKVSLPICHSFSKFSLLNLSLPIRTLLCRLSLPIPSPLSSVSSYPHSHFPSIFSAAHACFTSILISVSFSLHSSSHLSLILHTILSYQPICNLSFSICLSSPHSCFLSVSPLHTFVYYLSHLLSTLFSTVSSFSRSSFPSVSSSPHFSFPSVTLPYKLSICLFLSILSFTVCLSFSLNSCFSSVSSSPPSLYRVFLFSPLSFPLFLLHKDSPYSFCLFPSCIMSGTKVKMERRKRDFALLSLKGTVA